MPLVEVSNAGFGYNGRAIFKNINLEVREGEVFCIVGPNGCGKTTFLDCLLGLLKLDQGDILLGGRNIKTIRPPDVAKVLAYVPQSHQKTFPYTVMEIVLMGRASYTGIFSSPSPADISIAEEALAIVGLQEYRNRPYTQLSGGEGQLVMIARALAQKTPVIIMDEPTAHLDFKHELTVLETMVQLVRNTGKSVIMATHFPNHAFYFENNDVPTSVALMDKLTFSVIGRPGEVLSEKNLKSLYRINARVVSYQLDHNTEVKQIIPISTLYSKESERVN
ncbi:MAG: ABC transporter ATP-binding protein [Desulfotomaculaceae bacterium]|nr:ABC transporter ATP-binding protein [Desulfotomaculaceae bacterium]